MRYDPVDSKLFIRNRAKLRKKLPRIKLIAIDRFRGIKRFIGFGQLSAAQLAIL